MDDIDKKITRLKILIAGHLSSINIKVESNEKRSVELENAIDKLEDKVVDMDKEIITIHGKINNIISEAIIKTVISIGGIIVFIYTLVQLIKNVSH